jgi:hypothetical protein
MQGRRGCRVSLLSLERSRKRERQRKHHGLLNDQEVFDHGANASSIVKIAR